MVVFETNAIFGNNEKYRQAPLIDCASSLYSVNAFSLNKMNDIEQYSRKFGNSAIYYKGERTSFLDIIRHETSPEFGNSLTEFKARLKNINFSPLEAVSKAWDKYSPYMEFVKRFLEGQVKLYVNEL